jgi:hypothetical protein
MKVSEGLDIHLGELDGRRVTAVSVGADPEAVLARAHRQDFAAVHFSGFFICCNQSAANVWPPGKQRSENPLVTMTHVKGLMIVLSIDLLHQRPASRQR